MQPEQLRAARAALNWSLERLAEASGVHRNTISNFETRKYMGEPEKVAAVKHALEAAGVIFNEGGEASPGVSLRRFQRGDLVRFRRDTRTRFDYNIAADEIGEVIEVEPHPPATGPTYRMQVRFGQVDVAYVFRFEYELVQAAPATPAHQIPEPQRPLTPAAIVDEFCQVCTSVRINFDLYRSLFEESEQTRAMLFATAPMLFGDLNRILGDNLFLQFCKITDPASTGGKDNLTTNYILERITWPEQVSQRLKELNERILAFRRVIEPARSKRLAHLDLPSQVQRVGSLGAFPVGADVKFLQDLQSFVNVAYGHFHDGRQWPIAAAMSTDTHQLVRAIEKSVVFDQCSRCDAGERAIAHLDYRDRQG